MSLSDKAEVLREHLALGAGLSVTASVSKAVDELGIASEVEGLTMLQMADACLAKLGAAVPGAAVPGSMVGAAVVGSAVIEAAVVEPAAIGVAVGAPETATMERTITTATSHPTRVLNGVWRYVRSEGTQQGKDLWGSQVKFEGMQGWINSAGTAVAFHLTSNDPQCIRGTECHDRGCAQGGVYGPHPIRGAVGADDTLQLTIHRSTGFYVRDNRDYVPGKDLVCCGGCLVHFRFAKPIA